MNIILTGFMGTGKTKVAKILAKKIGYTFVDLDELIEKKEKKPINKIFKDKGEKYFRICETNCIKKIVKKDKQVIATGGGAILKNFSLLKKHGKMVCLNAKPEIIDERVKKEKHRPLLLGDDQLKEIKKLLKQREVYYKKVKYQIDTSDKTPKEVAKIIGDKL